MDYNRKIQLNTDLLQHISGRIGKIKLSNLFIIDRQLTITCNDKISKMVTVIMINACLLPCLAYIHVSRKQLVLI